MSAVTAGACGLRYRLRCIGWLSWGCVGMELEVGMSWNHSVAGCTPQLPCCQVLDWVWDMHRVSGSCLL
jgi:hypothetical protein